MAIHKITNLELKILQQIWENNNSTTVSDIIERWIETDKPGYTTILKTLQKMEVKGIVGHRKIGKKYSYFSEVSKEQVTRNKLSTIIERIFGGNKFSFAEYLLKSSDLKESELEDLKKIIQQKMENK